jgi:hypothetical protein
MASNLNERIKARKAAKRGRVAGQVSLNKPAAQVAHDGWDFHQRSDSKGKFSGPGGFGWQNGKSTSHFA